MEKGTYLACDQCHHHKLKYIPLSLGCARCNRLGVRCTSGRSIKKRGRKPTKKVAISLRSANDAPYYSILDCRQGLVAFSLDDDSNNFTLRLSRFEACRLLEHFYESPNHEFHTQIIRRYRLLDRRTSRPTSPTLLLSVICVACFMPRADQAPVIPGRGSNELIALRQYLFDELIRNFHPRTLPDSHQVFDDAVTAFIITSIAPSEKPVESSLQYSLTFLTFIVQKLNLHIDAPELSMEDREEREGRLNGSTLHPAANPLLLFRLWWAAYIIDRHSSLSFNGHPRITDHECHLLPIYLLTLVLSFINKKDYGRLYRDDRSICPLKQLG